MSADNGIYIHKFKNGWAVTHAQAIENVYNPDGSFNNRILHQYFKGEKRFKTQARAMLEALRMYDEIMKDDFCPFCEYGIRII